MREDKGKNDKSREWTMGWAYVEDWWPLGLGFWPTHFPSACEEHHGEEGYLVLAAHLEPQL